MGSLNSVFIVTDDLGFGMNLTGVLTKNGYSPHIIDISQKALEEVYQVECPIVLFDQKDNISSSLEFLNTLKSHSPDSECIILANEPIQNSAFPDAVYEAFAYLQKPFSTDELLNSIKKAIETYEFSHGKDKNDDRFNILFNNSINPILVIDSSGNYLYGNQAACNFFECTHNVLFKKNIRDYIPLDSDENEIIRIHQKLWDKGGSIKTDYWINGRLKTLMLSITPGYWKGEKIIFGHGTDITELNNSEQKLKDHEEFIKAVLDNLPIGIAVNTIKPDIKLLYMNKNFSKFYRTSSEKLRNPETFWEAAYEDSEYRKYIKNRILEDIYDHNNSGKIVWSDIPIKRQGERTSYITTRNDLLPEKNLMIWSVWDNTEQKKAKQSLLESEQRFKWLYINAPIPYHILTTSGFIEDVNQRWCDVLGYSKEEVLGKEIFAFIVEDEREAARISFIKKKSSKQSFIEGSERKYLTKDGYTRVFRTYDFFVTDQNKNIRFIQTTIEDITEQKQAEEKQQRNLDRSRSLVDILQYPAEDNQEFLNFALNQAIELTQSKLGFIFTYNEDKEEIKLNSWSKEIISIKELQTVYQLEKVGLIGEAIRQRRAIIVNKNAVYPIKKGIPPWHTQFDKSIVVPIFIEKKIVAIIAVANRVTDYEESDALQLSLLMESVWRVVDRRAALVALRNSEDIQRNLINATQDMVILKDKDLNIIMANQAAQRYFNKPESEIIGKTDFELMPEEYAIRCHKTDLQALAENQLVVNNEQQGERYFESRKFPVPVGSQQIGLGAFLRDITQKMKSEASNKLQSTALEATANAIVITDPNGLIEWANPAFASLTGYSLDDCIGLNPRDLVYSGLQDRTFYNQMWKTITSGKVWNGRLVNRQKDGRLYSEEMTITPLLSDKKEILHFIAIKQDVTESEQRERELTVVANVSAALRSVNTRDEMFLIILDQLINQLKVEASTLVMHDQSTDEMVIELGRGLWAASSGTRIPPGKGLSRKILDKAQSYLNSSPKDPDSYYPELFINCRSTAAVPLVVQDYKLGVLFIGANRILDKRDVRLLTSVADIAANAIHRTTLHEKTQIKVDQLNSLRMIDQTINTSLDLRVTLSVILSQSKQLLDCNALAVLLSKPHTMWLEHATSLGFQSTTIEKLHLHIGSGIAGQSILERRLISSTDPQISQNTEADNIFLGDENFQKYFSIPLIVKGAVKGVLIVCYHRLFSPNPDWLEILNTLATQTAIAIDNDELFIGLQRSTSNLTIAYNETIEGWAKALELRDQETEGHSKRVTELTIRLANEMGIKDDEISNLMRGALLHDIGKMGIPDAILRKPGKLTDEEWKIIRKHPGDAYEMLSPIKYLQPALDIPYCHHERWDGTGYPRGLKGKEIPLSARIFAIVDVWDALTSDRPYRKAWSASKASDYIRSQSGKHFDPEVVDVFFNKVMID